MQTGLYDAHSVNKGSVTIGYEYSVIPIHCLHFVQILQLRNAGPWNEHHLTAPQSCPYLKWQNGGLEK